MPKNICAKVNVKAQLEFVLAYYDSAVHRFNHYTTSPPPSEESGSGYKRKLKKKKKKVYEKADYLRSINHL